MYTRKRTQLSDEPIWSISGDQGQGDQWRPAAVTVTEYEDFQVKQMRDIFDFNTK